MIQTLLTFPDRAIDILEANEELINSELVEEMELASALFVRNAGSTDAANFLKNLTNKIKKALAINEFREVNHESLVAYHNLMETLLTSPNETAKILATNQKLVDAGLFPMMEQVTQQMEQVTQQMPTNGSEGAADILQNLTAQLEETIDRENRPQLPTAKEKSKWRLWVGGAVILLSGLSISLLGNGGFFSPQTKSLSSLEVSGGKIQPVEIVTLKPVDSYQVSRKYTGTIAANRSSELGFERNGKLLSMDVDEGQKVEKGKILATLERNSLEKQLQELLAERSQAQAQLREMQAGSRPETIAATRATVTELEQQLELARSKRDRRKGLHEQGAISREQYEEVATEVNAQQARLNQAQSQLDELLAGTRSEVIEAQQATIAQIDARIANRQIDLNQSTLKAPFTGIIAAVNLHEGTAVSASQTVLRLVENDDIEAQIGVPTSLVEQIQLGSTQSLKIGNKTYTAKVASILPEVDDSTRTRTLILKLAQEAAAKVSPGQTANLTLNQTIATSGYWLPNTALVSSVRGLWSCYVIGEPVAENNSYRVERKDLEVLYTEGERVLVRGTLQKGDRVIVNGTNRITSGQLVSLNQAKN